MPPPEVYDERGVSAVCALLEVRTRSHTVTRQWMDTVHSSVVLWRHMRVALLVAPIVQPKSANRRPSLRPTDANGVSLVSSETIVEPKSAVFVDRTRANHRAQTRLPLSVFSQKERIAFCVGNASPRLDTPRHSSVTTYL